jgi:hypothetical protein
MVLEESDMGAATLENSAASTKMCHIHAQQACQSLPWVEAQHEGHTVHGKGERDFHSRIISNIQTEKVHQ